MGEGETERQQISRLKREAARLRERIEEIWKRCDIFHGRVERLKAELGRVNHELGAVRSYLEGAKWERDKFRTALEALGVDVERDEIKKEKESAPVQDAPRGPDRDEEDDERLELSEDRRE